MNYQISKILIACLLQTACLQASQYKTSKAQAVPTVFAPATTHQWLLPVAEYFIAQSGQNFNFLAKEIQKKQLFKEYQKPNSQSPIRITLFLEETRKLTFKMRAIYQNYLNLYAAETGIILSPEYTLRNLQIELNKVAHKKRKLVEKYQKYFDPKTFNSKLPLSCLNDAIKNHHEAYKLYAAYVKGPPISYETLCEAYCLRYKCYPGAYDTREGIMQELNKPDEDYRQDLLEEYWLILSDGIETIPAILFTAVREKAKSRNNTQPSNIPPQKLPGSQHRPRHATPKNTKDFAL